MIRLYRTTQGCLLEREGIHYLITADWDELINSEELYSQLVQRCNTTLPYAAYAELLAEGLLPPLQSQEVWASGVTYYNSKLARQEESARAGGGDFYERVYHAERPELFFKSTPQRVVGSGQRVRIRRDSTWDVPEPELTLVINARGTIVGYTVGNDMSSRSLEGENPLYLAQAKIYDGSAAVGPGILVPAAPLDLDREIRLTVLRSGQPVFQEATRLSQMKRQPAELADWLFRECSFPRGCLLMTGTGIIPPSDFSLQRDDEIRIEIEEIGTLINYVA
jgi:2-dehydro-3-deoxy-D-arabinonate dehydratase